MACAKWQGEGQDSDMAVMELGVASGFSPDQDVVSKVYFIINQQNRQ
jgi:hypothetical protein